LYSEGCEGGDRPQEKATEKALVVPEIGNFELSPLVAVSLAVLALIQLSVLKRRSSKVSAWLAGQ